MALPSFSKCNISIIGLGYVGMPLAIELARGSKCLRSNKKLERNVIGFDINRDRISELNKGYDRNQEYKSNALDNNNKLKLTSNIEELVHSNVFIITVPTPVDQAKKPDYSYLINATKLVARAIKEKNKISTEIEPIIIYESTVYPGATEEFCIPLIEKIAEIKLNKDFFCGYSPERIVPGDKKRTLTKITKVTSGSSIESAKWIDNLYGSIIKEGTKKASSIMVAEAAKVIENVQRDVNIALMNELAMIFNKIGIDTLEVIDVASSKWNFLNFNPGLVGGHCIGVDPYYLINKAERVGHNPQIITSSRQINNGMSKWIAEKFIKLMCQNQKIIYGSKVLFLGITFKANCSDIRNSGNILLATLLQEYGLEIIVIDPWINIEDIKKLKNFTIYNHLKSSEKFENIILTTDHKEFMEYSITDWRNFTTKNALIFDLKGIVNKSLNPIRI